MDFRRYQNRETERMRGLKYCSVIKEFYSLTQVVALPTDVSAWASEQESLKAFTQLER